MISLLVHCALTVGLRRTAQIMAFATMSSGDTLTPAKSAEFLSRFTNSIVRVASTSTKRPTWGALNALDTMALAIALRTPFTGMRSSRSLDHAGVSMLRNRLACEACRITSSRVISPASPVGLTSPRSTPRSFASLRMGGLATIADAEDAGTDDGRGGDCAGGPVTAPRVRRDDTWPLMPYPTSTAPWPSSEEMLLAVSETVPRNSASAWLGATGAGSAGAPLEDTEMIGVPTSTVWPSSTRIAATTPANGDGSSTSDFAVSISTSTWLTTTGSPTLTFQVTISASVSPSPTSG